MTTLALELWVLFTLDAAMAGWRAAAGRDGRIDKHAYYTRAVLEGVLFAQPAFALVALLGLALAKRDQQLPLVEAGERLVLVFGAYALVVMVAFLVRAIPNVDLRSSASVFFFAPALIVRPAVIVAGMAWAMAAAPRLEVVGLAGLSTVGALGLPRWLDRRRAPRSS